MLRHHRQHIAEPAVGEALANFDDGGMETAAEADRQHDAGVLRGGGDRLRARVIKRDRLLDVDVLAGGSRLAHLRLVLAVRGRQHDRVDARIGENVVVAGGERDSLLGAERLGARGGARVGARELDGVALALHGGDQRAAPAAQAR